MTNKQHSGAAAWGQTGLLLFFHLCGWSIIAAAIFRLGHGGFGAGLAGPLTAAAAWAVLASAEYAVQPAPPQTVQSEDSPWRKLAAVALFAIIPISSCDAGFSPFTFAGGVSLLVAGGVLRWWSLATLGPHFTWTTGLIEGHQVIRKGPYRYLKHPNYLGSALFAAGIALASGSKAGWIPALLVCAAVFRAARHESTYLRERLPGYR